MIHASICTIGDEILIGQVVDTNSAMISRRLGETGVRTSRMISLPDDREAIISIIRNQLENNSIVITTGGLGPTKDDITKAALAALSGSTGYVMHEGQLEIVIDTIPYLRKKSFPERSQKRRRSLKFLNPFIARHRLSNF